MKVVDEKTADVLHRVEAAELQLRGIRERLLEGAQPPGAIEISCARAIARTERALEVLQGVRGSSSWLRLVEGNAFAGQLLSEALGSMRDAHRSATNAPREVTPPPNPLTATFGQFRLGERSLKRLEGVHPDLLAVTHLAVRLSPIDFGITRTGGVRTIDAQRILRDRGASGTMRSRHLTGHAVDVAPLHPETGKYSGAPVHAIAIHEAHVRAGERLEVPLRWGGDWDGDGDWRERGENDLVHHELPRHVYGDSMESQSAKAVAFLRDVQEGKA